MDSKPDLQFERAEFTTPAARLACEACQQPIHDAYYRVVGKTCCERCKTEVELQQASGSGVGRFLRAALYGTGAGALGAGLWYGVRALTGYEVGLIAIVVGLMVGGAVRKGSGGRGGWAYQGLAMFLTYGSIVSTYVPFIVQGILQQGEETAGDKGPGATPASPAAEPAATPTSPASPETAPGTTPASPASREGEPSAQKLGPGAAVLTLLLGVALIGALAFAAPFLAGFQNAIGILIIGFGLYEAWKMNRRVPFVIEGPFRVGAAPPPVEQ
jgi:hypothetical protein